MDVFNSLSREDRVDLRRALTGPGFDPAAIRDVRSVEHGAFRFGQRLAMLEYYLLSSSRLWTGLEGLAAYLAATSAKPEAVVAQPEVGADTPPSDALPPCGERSTLGRSSGSWPGCCWRAGSRWLEARSLTSTQLHHPADW